MAYHKDLDGIVLTGGWFVGLGLFKAVACFWRSSGDRSPSKILYTRFPPSRSNAGRVAKSRSTIRAEAWWSVACEPVVYAIMSERTTSNRMGPRRRLSIPSSSDSADASRKSPSIRRKLGGASRHSTVCRSMPTTAPSGPTLCRATSHQTPGRSPHQGRGRLCE